MARETSIQAYNEIKASGLLSKRRWQVYDIVFRHGPLTGIQVIQIYQTEYDTILDSGSIKTRLSELRERGVLEELGETACPVTGNNVILWGVTDSLPQEVTKSMTSKEKIIFLKATCMNAVEALKANGFEFEAKEIESNLQVVE